MFYCPSFFAEKGRIHCRSVVTLARDALKSSHQLRSGRTQFLVMMKRQLAEDLLSFGSQCKQHVSTIILRACAMDESSCFKAVHQLNGAVVANLHTAG